MRVYLMKRNWRALQPEQRLAITLRYLATRDLPLSIALAYRVGESTIYKVVKETCDVLMKVLKPLYLRKPIREEWIKICNGFLRN
ncbi:uncharacterized protein LOC112589649 [Harpegnathos saltator]|uniref:uncharacterized protein LOC112589649 n=1 Tax=Harpegnathos saltator TaxID=610380 RepID=UPI000DBEE0AE|nr:uncharacterized protein LOC112589649 [Harpegnathos saltator]